MTTVMMGFSLLFTVISLLLACDGFLLDDRTKPATTSGPLLSDQHYNNLLNLIMTERQTRAKLEQHVVRLEQELLATQQGVTDIYHTSANNNATLEREARNWNTLSAKYNDLNTDHSLLKLKFEKLDMKHSNLENYTKVLEEKVASLQQLKGVTDLQTVLNVRNETKILREELRITNNSLNSLRNEAEARKQDFVALLNKADSTDHKLVFSVEAFDNKQNQTKLEMKLMQDEMQKLGTYQNQSFTRLQENLIAIEKIQNVTVEKQDMEIHNMSNRAAFTVCAKSETYSSGSTIIFPYVKTSYGVSSSAMSAMGLTGKFKCEKTGLYLISAYLMTGTPKYIEFHLLKNGGVISAFSSPQIPIASGRIYRTSTFLTIQYLNLDDVLYVNAGTSSNVYSDNYSCLSFLQLTNN